jgi:error-prone DNA polymerase
VYAELTCKSNFSFLRGASDSREYIARAAELAIPAVGIADVNGVYALPRAFEQLKHLSHIQLISGAELTIRDHPPIRLIARDRDAYGVLCRLITTAHAGKDKGEAHLLISELIAGLDTPKARGLIAIPTLTAETQLPLLKELFGGGTTGNLRTLQGRTFTRTNPHTGAPRTDDHRLYLPLCRYLDGLDDRRTEDTLTAARAFELPIVAHNDVHYSLPTRRRLQDCLTAIREGTTVKDAGFKLFGNEERYLKSPLQMRSLFKDLPDAIQATLEIAQSCTFSLKELTYRYPSELIPHGQTAQSHFEELVMKGAHRLYRGRIPFDVAEQIEHEFRLIRKLDYASYFLTIHDIVAFARERNIICQGRGSAANSICCYCLGITSIDPVRMNLLFERFISEDRGEPPDIDVDFEHERREEVIQFVYERYGRDHAGMVSAVRTYQERSAFLEISKAVGIPVGTMSAQELERDFDTIAGPEHADKKSVITELVTEVLDFPRHLSIHSGGFTLSADPIIETVPIEPARMEGRTIIQWDKNDLDTTGLLKVDLLSLGFLTALHKISDLVGIDWADIPPEDRATYDMICLAETEGTFQIESRAQRSMLPKTRPRNFYDLVVQVAIVRPGPSVGEMVHPYIKRREDERRGIHYPHHDEIFKKILGRTYGVPIFQEQVMKLAIERAGFTPGEADILRRSLASFRSAENVNAIAERFHEGLLKNGVKPEYAQELFGYLKGYAHYGFPESHAASFAMITYKSAYLKCHYPAEFLCGLINSQPMGFYSVDTLIQCARRAGVVVRPIDPRVSEWDATMEEMDSPYVQIDRNPHSGAKPDQEGCVAGRVNSLSGVRPSAAPSSIAPPYAPSPAPPRLRRDSIPERAVRMGFREVAGLREEDVQRLIEERRRTPFRDLQDFIVRSQLSTPVLEKLALADAFRCFGQDQRSTLWKSLVPATLLPDAGTQASFEQLSLFQSIQAEHDAFGYSTKGNLMLAIRAENPHLPPHTSRDLRAAKQRITLTVSGITIVMQRPPTAKGTCFITLEDEHGTIDLILRKEVYEKYRAIVTTQRLLIARGKVQIFGVGRSLQVEEILEPGKKVLGRNLVPGGHPRSMGPF